MKEFITIIKDNKTEIIEKKSRFITTIMYVESAKEAEEKLKQIKKDNIEANHNCSAYRILEDDRLIERSSDDGEPAGTAGSVMLNVLQKNNIVNVIVVVTRYFGGILLGAGGLVRIYSNSVTKIVEETPITLKVKGEESEIVLEYKEIENFKYYCKKNEINIINMDYLEQIICIVSLTDSKKEQILADINKKTLKVEFVKTLCIKYVNKSI